MDSMVRKDNVQIAIVQATAEIVKEGKGKGLTQAPENYIKQIMKALCDGLEEGVASATKIGGG